MEGDVTVCSDLSSFATTGSSIFSVLTDGGASCLQGCDSGALSMAEIIEHMVTL